MNGFLMPTRMKHGSWCHKYIWKRCVKINFILIGIIIFFEKNFTFIFLFSKTQFYRHGTVTDLRTPEGKALAIKCFEAHIELVKKLVPPHQLLVFHPKDGYEPLCKFIGVPVPDEPFPHSNDRENFQKNISKINCYFLETFFEIFIFRIFNFFLDGGPLIVLGLIAGAGAYAAKQYFSE